MPTRHDMACTDLRCNHPLPDREGILSPRITRHPSACYARRPEFEPSRTAGFFHNEAPGKASGNYVHPRPVIPARMLCPYRITGLWHGIVRDGSNPPLPLPHREGKTIARA